MTDVISDVSVISLLLCNPKMCLDYMKIVFSFNRQCVHHIFIHTDVLHTSVILAEEDTMKMPKKLQSDL